MEEQMNLNFYNPANENYLQQLQNTFNDNLAKLEQLKNITLATQQVNNANSPNYSHNNQSYSQPQRYYLDCGIKEDWQEFLTVNYGITEQEIFEDYKLFLQAKMELTESTDKEKVEAMKKKLSKSSVSKVNQYVSNSSMDNNKHINVNDKQQMETNTADVSNKGVKYVR